MGMCSKFDLQKGDGSGKDGFGKVLAGLVTANYKAIIIVADNDGDPAGAFQNVQRQIKEAGFTVPNRPRETVATEGLSALTVLMIPWDEEAGCLETLCLGAANTVYIRQLECADALVKCANAEEWGIAKKSKLRMRGFLSAVCKSDPNTGLRYAWSTDGGRPGNIFPLKGVDAYKQIADYFKEFAA